MITDKFYDLAKNELFKLNRSITGKGTLKTLKIIKKYFPELKIKSFHSGEKVYDWKIPPEWNVKEAFVEDKYKKKIIDFKNNNLNLVGYSAPTKKTLSKKDFLKKVYSNKKIKNAIPFVTSYYKKNWGFCLSYNDKKKIEKNYTDIDKFKVKINSSFNSNGKLHYGEVLLGNNKNKKEILISTYVCHPSMANNELSGPILSMSLINYFRNKKLNINIRFLFIPETIGSIAYISRNFKFLKKNIIGGYNLTCVGDEKTYSCIPSPSQKSASDIALFESYKELRIKFKKYDFLSTAGSDERQYNHPSVNLGITVVCRSKFSSFKEYHTSLDDFNLVTKKGIYGSYLLVKRAIFFMQKQIYPKPTTVCEPKLDKHHLMKTVSTTGNRNIYLDFLRYADGKNSLDIIAKKTKFQLQKVKKIYYILKKKKNCLLKKIINY